MENFVCCNRGWRAYLIHSDQYRISDEYGQWFIVTANNEKDAIKKATPKIKRIFKNGDPNTNPRIGDTFEVLADTISFRVGTHSRNFNGTGSETAKKGDIIVFDREGDENGFWNFPNDADHGRLQGSRPWSLIYDERIKKVYEDPTFKAAKEHYRTYLKGKI